MCDAYLCSMFDRIKAYIRLQKIISARIREWENFMAGIKSFQQRDDKGSCCDQNGNNTEKEAKSISF